MEDKVPATEEQVSEPSGVPVPKAGTSTKKKIFIGIGAVLAVALLAGAAFMAVRLINSNGANGNNSLLAGLGAGGPGGVSFSIQITPAPELPNAKADLSGQVTSVQNNSVFVAPFEGGKGGGANVVIVGKAISGGSSSSDSGPSTNIDTGGSSPTPSGPTTEVVITKDTKIYRDASMDSVPKPQPGSGDVNMGIQQVLDPVDISQIVTDSMVQVWGQKRGDRLIADTIVVMGVAVFSTGGKPPQ